MARKEDDIVAKIDQIVGAQNLHDLTTEKAFDESRSQRVAQDIKGFRRFIFQIGVALHWIWSWILWPIWRTWRAIFFWFLKQYRKLWSLSVYKRNKYGTLMLSKTRAGVMLFCTAVFLCLLPFLIGFTYDCVLYATTAKTEIFYLHGTQETDVEGNVHSAKGCSRLPCSDEDSTYFRITPSIFNHLWAIFHDGHIFYPDLEASAIPDVVNECHITTYGLRIKFLMRNTNIYPEILRVSCTPVK